MLKLDITGFTEDEILNYTLVGLLARHQAMTAKIAEIRSQLGAPAPAVKRTRTAAAPAPVIPATEPTPAPKPAVKARRPLSPEALANIVKAQKKRWAKVRKENRAKTAAVPGKKGRIQLADPEPEPALAAAGD